MAERRMFAKTIIDSDAFLDMPMTSQLLYFHLSMRADDEGFINNPKRIQRMIGASDDDLRMLIAKAFIIPFESGVVVIKHWRINNYIQKDRFKETIYSEERKSLFTKKDGAYTLDETQAIQAPKHEENTVDTECIQNVYNMDTQVRLDCLLSKLKNKLSSAGAYTGVHDALIDEVLTALVKGCELNGDITLNGDKYTAAQFERIANHLTVEQVAFVVNRLLNRRDEIQNRELYIMSVLASKYALPME